MTGGIAALQQHQLEAKDRQVFFQFLKVVNYRVFFAMLIRKECYFN